MTTETTATAPRLTGTELERDRHLRAALSRLGEPGDPRLTGLVAEYGAARVHELLASERDLHGLQTDVAARLGSLDPGRELAEAARVGMRFVVPDDEEWPEQLSVLGAAGQLHARGGVPVGLWVRGPVRLDSLRPSVAIVGSRACTTYGESVAAEMATTAAEAGVAVVSGAAYGIDVAAHRAALAGGGATVAVLACSAERAYPVAHRALIDHLAAHGAVISEAPPGSAPLKIRFLARNRLIAALASATVIVEAAVRSGAINTASWAGLSLRPVLAVPGPVTSGSSVGTHELIRSGDALLATGGRDVLEVIGAAGEHLRETPREAPRRRDRLDSRQRQVLDAVPVARAATGDSIARVAGMGVLEVRGTLTRLAERGLVVAEEDGWRLAAEPA